MKMRRALVIFTKLPVRGQVKTRLASAVSEELAAELQRRFLLDILSIAKQGNWEAIISYAPESSNLKSLIKTPIHCIPQKGSSLGGRMGNAFRAAFNEGYHPVVMIGTDIPTLPLHFLTAAFKALKDRDVVLGPSVDGGYYLIGMHCFHEEIFRGVEWSTPRVLHQTVRRIKQEKLKLACLDVWYDVDTLEDLVFLKAHIEYLQACGRAFPVNTYRLLKKLRL
jgi:hypothetical protein